MDFTKKRHSFEREDKVGREQSNYPLKEVDNGGEEEITDFPALSSIQCSRRKNKADDGRKFMRKGKHEDLD